MRWSLSISINELLFTHPNGIYLEHYFYFFTPSTNYRFVICCTRCPDILALPLLPGLSRAQYDDRSWRIQMFRGDVRSSVRDGASDKPLWSHGTSVRSPQKRPSNVVSTPKGQVPAFSRSSIIPRLSQAMNFSGVLRSPAIRDSANLMWPDENTALWYLNLVICLLPKQFYLIVVDRSFISVTIVLVKWDSAVFFME